jgi:hypothetical protein
VQPKAFVDIRGSTRTDFPDGSYLIEGAPGEKYIVSESGDINGTIPEIRRVQIENLALVVGHEITRTPDMTSHTLYFAGGGIFSYLHYREGRGMSIQAKHIHCRTLPDGVISVFGTAC